jgi:hypothetical protein
MLRRSVMALHSSAPRGKIAEANCVNVTDRRFVEISRLQFAAVEVLAVQR